MDAMKKSEEIERLYSKIAYLTEDRDSLKREVMFLRKANKILIMTNGKKGIINNGR
jgi:hypothetical protein